MKKKIIREIYSRLQDCESKRIFEKRMLYDLTYDYRFMLDMIQNTAAGLNISSFLESKKDFIKIIYGFGGAGQVLMESYPQVGWDYYIDNGNITTNKQITAISIQELQSKLLTAAIFVTPIYNNIEIMEQLNELGFNRANILNVGEMISEMYEKQYFDVLPLCDGKETFVDCGCYDGATTLNFIRHCNGQYEKILAFEPDSIMLPICTKNLLNKSNLSIYSCGLWNEDTTLQFYDKADGTSSIIFDEKNEGNMLEVKRLDGIVREEHISFMKLDIEGAELNALKGAKDIIRKYKPKLAVCIYHKSEDIWKIPSLLLEYCSDYIFYIRHYSLSWNETVLYAIVKEEKAGV